MTPHLRLFFAPPAATKAGAVSPVPGQKSSGNETRKAPSARPAVSGRGKPAPTPDDLKNLVPFLGDEQLFGIYNEAYQKERNKKFLNVTLALSTIQKYLKGEGEQASIARQRVVEWLSDPELLKDAIPTQARKNLVWVLDRVKGDPGVAGILGALKKNYGTPAAPVAKPDPQGVKPKSREEVAKSVTPESILGDQGQAYMKEKNGKYLNMTMALISVDKFLNGKDDALPVAKARLVEWLAEKNLLRDPVALLVRKNLIRFLSVPVADADFGKNLQELVGYLKADYTVHEPKPAVEDAPQPEAEAKPSAAAAATKESEEPPAAKPGSYKTMEPWVFTFPSPEKPGPRDDTFETMWPKLRGIFHVTYEKYRKDHPELRFSMTMHYKMSNLSGAVASGSFTDVKIFSNTDPKVVESMLREIAGLLYRNISFEKYKSGLLPPVIYEQAFVPAPDAS
jgi:hypothetical protein